MEQLPDKGAADAELKPVASVSLTSRNLSFRDYLRETNIHDTKSRTQPIEGPWIEFK